MTMLTRWENRWNPFKEMEDLHSRLSALINRSYGRVPVRGDAEGEESITFSEWAPLVDVTEDDQGYVIKAELPEVKKEDVKVTVENGVLMLAGERKLEKEEKSRRYHRIERSYGKFVRSFTLPDDAETDRVNAEFRDGVLRISVAKAEKARPKSIVVKVA